MLLPPKQAEAEHRSARSTRNAVQHDDGSDNDDIEKASKSKKRAQKKVNASREAAANNIQSVVEAFANQRGYGSNLVTDLKELHSN